MATIGKKLLGLALIGGAVAYYLRLKPAVAEAGEVSYEMKPITIPKVVSKAEIEGIISKIKPKLRPTLKPLGWMLEFDPVNIPLPFGIGSITYTFPSKQLPLMAPARAQEIARKFIPRIEEYDFYYKVYIPPIKVKV